MEVHPYSLALSEPLSTARGTLERREGFLVRIDHDGTAGVGEAAPLPGWTESLEACRDALERAADAAAEGDLAAGHAALDADETPAAAHAFSLALADASARADGQPLYRALGGRRERESVPANAVVGDAGTETTAGRASEAVEAGFEAVKVKVGARPVGEDVARLRAVREAVGPDVTLRADANGGWTGEEAERALDGFAAPDVDLDLVEQPLPAADLAGHAGLRGGSVAVALDESLLEYDVGRILEADAADALVVKPMVHGGPGRALTLAKRARGAGLTPVVTTTVDAVVARTAAVHVAASLPFVAPSGLATADLLAEDLGPDPCPVDNGEVRVPGEPGLGVSDLEV